MSFVQSFLALFYPHICPGCNQTISNRKRAICISCWTNLPRTYQYKDKANHIAKLFWGRYPLEHAFTTFKYHKKGTIQKIIHDLKYQGNQQAGEELGKEIGKEVRDAGLAIDCIIPVPLHPHKLQKRGYNQSYAIALGIQAIINAPIDHQTLIRAVDTDSQTKKSKYQRWENVSTIFKLTNTSKLNSQHVLLVDDVITTGSTIEGCCLTLDQFKDIKISVVALASA
ncbi:MAG: ComF family protein [Flavobacteriales bacterium]|jgi:ComF family protein|nr:ComF family protein [Flavobacteriales bacterium]